MRSSHEQSRTDSSQAGGNSGSFMAQSLLDTGRFNITAISRPDSKSPIPAGIKVVPADYSSHDSLVAAMKGQDALIITLSIFAPKDTQPTLIRAAADAGVPWVLPNHWGTDVEDPAVRRDVPAFEASYGARAQIMELGKSAMLDVACGFWYEWSLAIPASFGFDFANKTATFFDDGKTKISISTWPQVGRAVTALLSLPIKPESGNKERCLEHFKNTTVYVNSFTISQQDMLDSVLRVTGDKAEDWNVTREPARERYAAAAKALKEGTDKQAYVKMMYTRIFFDDGNGNFEANRGLANGILGLKNDGLDEATRRAIKRATEEHAPRLRHD